MTMTIRPGEMSLAMWRAIYRGGAVSLDRAADAAIGASAEAVERILARHAPVYGINTGFGKLASVRIGDEDLEALQRNIVLSHAAGVGEAVQPAIVRLMLALKLASLAQGHSGVRPATIAMLQDMLDRGITPINSSGDFLASGILVDVTGDNADDAREKGWREAQRQGWAQLYRKINGKFRKVARARTTAGGKFTVRFTLPGKTLKLRAGSTLGSSQVLIVKR